MNLFEILPLDKDIEDYPKADVPHYIAAAEGMYLRKETALGTCLIPQKDMPKHLKSIGDFKNGGFWWSGVTIPSHIMSQTVDFFRRVWENDKTEAEILLLLRNKRYRIYVPWQIVSTASVHSIYDPAEVPSGWQVVGTIHSHCDFSAAHSSVDDHDAKTFNGVHITIGNLDESTPDYDAMVVINGVTFRYAIDVIADTNLKANVKAPKRWDKFITSRTEILDKSFTSLTKEDIEKWLNAAFPPKIKYTVSSPSKHTLSYHWSDAPAYEDFEDVLSRYSKKEHKTTTAGKVWSKELGTWVNTDHFVSGSGLLSDFHFKEDLKARLEQLFEVAMERNIFIDFDLIDFEKDDDTLELEASSRILLPNAIDR